MFWILRRTEAFINSFNNNTSKSIERKESGEDEFFNIKNLELNGRVTM